MKTMAHNNWAVFLLVFVLLFVIPEYVFLIPNGEVISDTRFPASESLLFESPKQALYIKTVKTTPHEPIFINGDEDFVDQHWPGDGTPRRPYRIENLYIEVKSWDEVAIVIINTQADFMITNCHVEGPGRHSGTYGIGVLNVSTGRILNCNITGHRYGIRITECQNVMVSHCFFKENLHGVALDYRAKYNIISDNLCIQNEFALYTTLYSKHNIMTQNTVMNGYQGIVLTGFACNNSITWNTLINNSFNAIDVYHCNWWDLNGYSEYNGTDINRDGIGDSPYNIHTVPDYMINASKDYRPRMLPMNEHYQMSWEMVTTVRLVVIAILIIVVVSLIMYVMKNRGYFSLLRRQLSRMSTT